MTHARCCEAQLAWGLRAVGGAVARWSLRWCVPCGKDGSLACDAPPRWSRHSYVRGMRAVCALCRREFKGWLGVGPWI